ncbi:hypothetical protein ABFX02_14G106700 [Erythranthe guttata]
MEASVGTISEGEWNSTFIGMCSDEADFMAQLLGSCSTPNESSTGFAWPVYESNTGFAGEGSMYSPEETNNNHNNNNNNDNTASMYSSSWSATSNNSQECYYPGSSVSHQFFGNSNNNFVAMDHIYCPNNGNAMEGYHEFMNPDVGNGGGDAMEYSDEKPMEQKLLIPEQPLKACEISKKRTRINGEVQRSKRSMKTKNCRKFDDDEEDNNNNNNNNNNNKNNAVLNRQSSSVGCSEDNSNVSHEMKGVASGLCSKGSGPASLSVSEKTRAGRGSATDPQSLYARKRRERINERLRVLQNLVPNGTKVDISTMLEEAVEYVKFLQLQIKLLSSDEMWMYSPIAYNGMDLGLDLKISTQK